MKGEVIPEHAVRFVRDFDASGEKIWAFLTESSRLPQWYGEGSIEPREGGAVALMGGHIRGVVTGWQLQKFLAYTWNVFSPGDASASNSEAVGQTKKSRFPISYLEFRLEGSRLTLIHRPIPPQMQSQTMMGWHTMLDLIAAGLAGDFPARSDIVPKNAALYGVDMTKLKT